MNILSALVLLFFLSPVLASSSARNSTLCRPVKICLRRLNKGKDCPLLPVPPHLIPPPPPAKGYLVRKVRPGVFTFFDTSYTSIILYRAGTLALIDFPNGTTTYTPTGEYRLISAVEEVLAGRKVSKFLMAYSHRHVDHIGGARIAYDFIVNKFPDVLKEGVSVYGSEDTLRALLAGGIKTPVPVPNIIVGRDRPYLMVLSPSVVVQLSVLPGHTEEDLVAHLKPSDDGPGMVHWVDFLSPGAAPFIDFAFTVNLGRYILSHEELLAFNFTRFSGGHNFGYYANVLTNLRYTWDVVGAAAEAPTLVPPEELRKIAAAVQDPSAPQFGNVLWASSANLNLAVNECKKKIIEKYGCSLLGVDVTIDSLCKEALIYKFLDVQPEILLQLEE